MADDSVWERLGVPYVVPFEELDKMNARIQQIQVELLTTIEALSTRLALIEGKMSILEIGLNPEEKSDNVFDFVSREELGIESEEVDEAMDDGEMDITYVESGFSAPVPGEDEESEDVEELEEDIIFESIEDEEGILSIAGPDVWALNIVEDIKSNGGSINQYWKRFGLMPKEVSPTEKTSMLASLKQLMVTEGISKYNVNRMRHFYYYGTPEEGEEKYNAYIA
tara:strand:+ start:248 stop:919 length:672 start_codon:yes stop_codon:yes gene_type:complete